MALPDNPLTRKEQYLASIAGQNKWLLSIGENGVMTFSNYGGDTAQTAPAGAWLPFNAVFLGK